MFPTKPLVLALTLLSAVLPRVTAQVVPGTYVGLFSPENVVSPQTSGSFKLTATASGAFSGSLQLEGQRLPFSGKFDGTGFAEVAVRRQNAAPLSLELQVDSDPDHLTGELSSDEWEAELDGDRNVFNSTNTAPQTGNYTAIFPDDAVAPNEPQGIGFGTFSVKTTGSIAFTGTLPAKTKLTQASQVPKSGRWPLYISLNGGRGLVWGWLDFVDEPESAVDGTITWIKPAGSSGGYPTGFTNELNVMGSAYQRPAKGTTILDIISGAVAFSGGPLAQGFTNLVLIDDMNRVRNVDTNKLTMKFTLGSGAFQGEVKDPASAKTLSFSGVVLQQQNTGIGFFTRTNLAGFVSLKPTVADVIGFESTGNSFSADIQRTNAQIFRWLWSDGTSSSGYPVASKNFGSRGSRRQYLIAYPPGSLTSINIGFDAGDGGELTPLNFLRQQKVRSVYFPYPLTGVRYLASSYNPLTSLDFTGFDQLEIIECFRCTNLQHVVVTNLPSLRRACFEECDLQELDLTGNPNLEDLRAALNAYSEIVVGGGTGPKVWHWCTRDNPQLTQYFQDIQTNFFSLQELINRHDGQSGSLIPISTVVTNIETENNEYTFADFTGQANLQKIWLFNNNLTNILIDGCSSLQIIDVHNNQLPALVIDSILTFLDTLENPAAQLQVVNLIQNAVPTPAGLEHYESLTNKGVVIWLDLPNP